MDALKMIIVPHETETRLVAKTAATSGIWLRATLPTMTLHPQALPLLLTALGSFVPVHAALVVATRAASFATRLYPGWFPDVGGPGYELQVIGDTRRERAAWWCR